MARKMAGRGGARPSRNRSSLPDEQSPFADVRAEPGGFSIPELKWRELLFVGAMRRDGETFVRDPARPLPPFARPDLFPDGVRFWPPSRSVRGSWSGRCPRPPEGAGIIRG